MCRATAAAKLSSFLEKPRDSRVNRFTNERIVESFRSMCGVCVKNFAATFSLLKESDVATASVMGRKPLAEKDRRAKPLRIRLTDAERAEIDKAAVGKTSTWARNVLLRAARRSKKD